MNHRRYKYIIGIDEVGRGPLAGPVSVGAFIVSFEHKNSVYETLSGITDSKKLTEKKRNRYVEKIALLKKQQLCDYSVVHVSAKIIDKQGIVFAINTALKKSLKKLSIDPLQCFVYLDGGLSVPIEYYQETVVRGDSKIWQISAASVIGKVLRDKKMVTYGKKYPEYGFEHHKGYGTQNHRNAIQEFGTIDIHRKTWIKT